MKIKNLTNQQTFKADWFHLPKGAIEGYMLSNGEIAEIKSHLTDSFAVGHVKGNAGKMPSKIYKKRALFMIHGEPIVLANTPVANKAGKKLPFWAIFLQNQIIPEGITGVFRNAEGVKDAEFDALRGFLFNELRKIRKAK